MRARLSPRQFGVLVLGLAAVVVSTPRAQLQIGIQSFFVSGNGTNVWQLTKGPDRAVWFTLSRCDDPACVTLVRHDAIVRITADGEMTEFPLPFTSQPHGAGPFGITAGSDGALWFTEIRGDAIGRVTTEGELTFYPLPPSPIPGVANAPYAITTGPDGALWFTQAFAIGRISTTGDIVRYPVSTSVSSDPTFITAGPDGALWFTMVNVNAIGRITTSGTMSRYSLSSPCGPYGIASGPDGALWFACGAGSIGRITVDGTVSFQSVPTPDGFPTYITAGPDGALWFTEQHSNVLGRITTTGTVAEYESGTGVGHPVAMPITSDDDSVWFGKGNYVSRAMAMRVDSVRFGKSSISGCLKTKAYVTLVAPAPEEGFVVTLGSSNAHAVVPASITFKAGTTRKSVSIVTSAVASIESATISATAGGYTVAADLTLTPMGLKMLTLSPNPVIGGESVDGTVTLECAAGPGPITVDLSSTKPTVASPTTANVTVAAGSTSAPFRVTTTAVTAVTKPSIKGAANGVTKSKTLTVNPAR